VIPVSLYEWSGVWFLVTLVSFSQQIRVLALYYLDAQGIDYHGFLGDVSPAAPLEPLHETLTARRATTATPLAPQEDVNALLTDVHRKVRFVDVPTLFLVSCAYPASYAYPASSAYPACCACPACCPCSWCACVSSYIPAFLFCLHVLTSGCPGPGGTRAADARL
jgi:hypothetical protein